MKSYPYSFLPSPRSATRSYPAAGQPPKSHAVALAVIALLLAAVTYRAEDTGEGLDAQVATRMVGYAMAAVAVLFALGGKKFRLTPVIALWTALPICLGFTALYAPQPLFAAIAGITNLIVLLFCWSFTDRHGPERSALVLILGGAVICFASIVTFYGYPELARTNPDYLTGDPGGRMRGVAGAANALGSVSAFTLLMAIVFFQRLTRGQRRFAVMAMALSAIALLASGSRSSIFALLVGLAIWRAFRGRAAANLILILTLALIACAILVMSPDLAGFVTREGRSDDLTTLNGRSLIWSVAWEHIVRHPVSGLGFGASRMYLSSDDRLFAGAVHAHNMYLELLFSGGAIALGLFAAAFAVTGFRSAMQRRAEALAALLFFAILGVTEATPFAGLPQFQSFAFFTAVSLCLVRARIPPRRIVKRRPVVAARPAMAT